MKIGVNAIGFISGKVGGTETYVKNLWKYLQLVDNNNEYMILCSSKYSDEFRRTNDQFKLGKCNYLKPSINWLIRGIIRNTINTDILKSVIDKYNFDVIHFPFTVLSPIGLASPSVLTFWDMQHEFYPEFFSNRELRTRQALYKPSVENATRVIVSAEFTKRCLVERYGIKPEKIDVIHTGYGHEYRIIEDQEALDKIRTRYGLFKPFMYYPAATWPHKNHKTLLAAFRLLIDRYPFDGHLVFSGIAMQWQREIMEEITKLGLDGSVKILGYLPNEELPYLYNLARIMVFPSLFEGFGIPLVEAMACGCPVVCSDATSIPEVVGKAGIIFDPLSKEDIAEKIWSAWNADSRIEQMKRTGIERVKLFNWEFAARKTIEVYKKAVAQT